MTTTREGDSNHPRRRRSVVPRMFGRLVAGLAGLYALYVAVMYFGQARVLFLPLPGSVEPSQIVSPPVECISLDTGEGRRSEAWFVPAEAAGHARPAPVVIYFHGHLELINPNHDTVRRLRAMGCSVLLPEYRGCGRSDGPPEEAGIIEDMVRFHDRLIERPDVDPGRIAYLGQSLGGAPAAALAARREPRALILEATFSSVAEIAPHFLLPRGLAWLRFPTAEYVAGLHAPILIAHGTFDSIIPIAHGHRIRDAARRPVFLEYPTGHVGFIDDDAFWLAVRGFLADNGVVAETAPGVASPSRR